MLTSYKQETYANSLLFTGYDDKTQDFVLIKFKDHLLIMCDTGGIRKIAICHDI